ncbi:MAG: FecR family protein [Treponema sp.]|nr:FecR family protein [Treponema sp.]
MERKNQKFLFLTFLFLTACFYAGAQTPGINTGASSGVIQEIRGNVEIKLPGAADFTGAKAGDRLTQDTIISTGFKSYAVIEIGSSSITVRPLTRLALNEMKAADNSETLNVSLQSGRVRVDVHPPAGTRTNMSVRSPSAVASVRGTCFELDTRNLFVEEGSVTFQGNKGKEIIVNAGSSGRVDTNDRVSRTADIRTARTVRLSPLALEPGKISGLYRGPVRGSVPYTIGLEFVTN